MSAVAERRFGVEIECGHKQGRDWVADELKANNIPHQYVDYDGSGCEVQTEPLQGEEGFAKLKELMDFLKDIGCYVKKVDGQHIHIEALDYRADKDLRYRFIQSYLTNRDHIVQFIDPYRRDNYHMCANAWAGEASPHAPAQVTLDGLKAGNAWGMKGYDINLYNLREGNSGTIEIRLHEGNLDYDKAQAWITFWQGFLDHVKEVKVPLGRFKSHDTLIASTGIAPELREKLKEAAKRYEEGKVMRS